MNEEQPTNGATVNPAANAHAPRQVTPVMDVVPPPTAIAAAPPEMADVPPISDELAEQIAADATMPPLNADPANDQPTETPAMATPPEEQDEMPAPIHDTNDSPDELIQSETQRENLTPPPAAFQAPKESNPALIAVVVAIFATVALSALAIFAYMSTQ